MDTRLNSSFGHSAVSTFVFVLSMAFSAPAFGAAAQVVSASGEITVTAKDGTKSKLRSNDKIGEGAVINTNKGATAKLLFSDDTIIDIGPESEFKIDEYSGGEGESRRGIFSMAYGTIRSLVSKPVKGGNYKVKTRDAVMGVRGTEFVVSTPFVPAGDANPGALSSNVFVASGTVAVSSSLTAAGVGGEIGSAAPTTTVQAGQAFSTSQFTAPAVGGSQSAGAQGGQTGSGAQAAASQSSGGTTSQPQEMSSSQISSVMNSATVQDSTFSNSVSLDSSGSGDSGGGATSQEGSSGAESRNPALLAATGAMGETVAGGVTNALGGAIIAAPVPTGLSVRDVITAPPVNILPGTLKTVTIIVQ